MSFNIIPYGSTKIKVDTIPGSPGNFAYFKNVSKINRFEPDKILIEISYLGNTSSINYEEVRKVHVFATDLNKRDDFLPVEKQSGGSGQYLRIPYKYIEGSIVSGNNIGYIAEKRFLIKKIETNGEIFIYFSGGIENNINVSDKLYIPDTTTNDVIEVNVLEITTETGDSIMTWLKDDIYALDNHSHISMANTIKTEPRGDFFFSSTGSNRNGMMQNAKGLIGTLLFSFPLSPATATFKSHMDGRVRTVVASLHPPETAMVENFSVLFPAIYALKFTNPLTRNKYFAFSNIARQNIAFLTAKYRLNWADLYSEIYFYKNKMFINDTTRLKLISNQSLYNTYFPAVRETFDESTEVLRALMSLEGAHPFDMDKTSFDPSYGIGDVKHPDHATTDPGHVMYGSSYDPAHDYYGGYAATDVDKCIERLNYLMTDPDAIIPVDPEEKKKFAIGLISWTPMHHYWNGMGGNCKSVPKKAMTFFTMPDQRRYMNRHAGTKTIVEFGDDEETIYLTDRGILYDKNTHLTELGRQMIKEGLRNGLTIDIKHSHPQARNQIYKMVENNYDRPPIYNIYGNPKTITENNNDNGANPIEYPNELYENIATVSGSSEDHHENERPFPLPGNNLYQVCSTHSALSFVDNVSSCYKEAFDKRSSTQYLTSNTKNQFLAIEKYLYTNLMYKKFKKISQQGPDKIKIVLENSIENDVFDNDDKTILGCLVSLESDFEDPMIVTDLKNKIKEYVNRFFITHIIRNCYQPNSINLSNDDIEKIIKLKGVIGVTSEDRVQRSNERMPFDDFFLKMKKAFFNINLWPMYGDDIVEEVDVDGTMVKFLLGKTYKKNPSQPFLDYQQFTSNDARIPIEDEIAYGETGIFWEIQAALEWMHEESNEKYKTDIPYLMTLDLNRKLFKKGEVNKNYKNVDLFAIAGIEGIYQSIDQIARVAREKVYYSTNPDTELAKYALNVGDRLNDDDPVSGDIGIRTKLKKYYENICISSDFDGLDDPLNLFASPRMFPIMALYVANRLKWDLYRRYYGKDLSVDPIVDPFQKIVGNFDIGRERGQTLNVDDGLFKYDSLSNTGGLTTLQSMDEVILNNFLNDTVKEILIQIFDTNFINMVANAQGWV